MNVTILKGNLTKNIELRYTTKDMAIARFNLAVRRDIKNKDGQYDSDFISCIAYGKTAELLSKYTEKGSKLLITGRITTGSYENTKGDKVYTTDILVNTVEFLDKKKETQEATKEQHEETHDPFKEMGDKVSEDSLSLPF